MRFSTAALLASLLLASSGAALAQVTPEVTVNPAAAAPGRTLLYPGGTYARTVTPLLQPGETPGDTGPIVLHLPTAHHRTMQAAAAPHRRHKTEAVASTEPAPQPAAPPPPAPPPPRPVHHAPHRTASTARAPSSGYNPGYGAFGVPQEAPAPSSAPAAAGKPQSAPPSTPDLGGLEISRPQAAAAPATRQQVAKAAPPPPPPHPAAAAEHATAGLTKRSVILFAPGAPDPAASALGAIKFLAGDLNAAMTGPSTRVQLDAYGGPKGDKGSDARRLSLKRALAIRQVLINDGVPAERIDVRAMGGVDDSGPADRVDVYVKA